MKIKYVNFPTITYFPVENLIYLPLRYERLKEKSLAGIKDKQEIVYSTNKYTAYADIELTFTSEFYRKLKRYNNEFLVIDKIENIRRKEYHDAKINCLNKISEGLECLKAKKEYIKKCNDEFNVKVGDLTQKFI